MFRELRKKNRELTKEDSIKILKSCDYGILSCLSENGYAYGVPLSYVYMNNSIYFHSATEGHKIDSIKNNNKISFCVVGKTQILPEKFSTEYESVIVFGLATEVHDNEKNLVLLELINKYSPNYLDEGTKYIKNLTSKTKVIKITIENISAKGRKS